jgi:outer membrane protein assembly factor BamA
LQEIRTRIRKSGRFESVEIRKRYRSMSSTDRVHLIILVKEKPPLKKKWMFFPILQLNDEYGFTFGGRFTFIDLFGANERITIPLTWGGVRQARAEASFSPGFGFDEYLVGGGILQKENPHFRIDDRRNELKLGARKQVGVFRLDLGGDWTSVKFDPLKDTFFSFKADAILDTRRDINLPGNAIYTGFGYERMVIRAGDSFNRFKVDLRGFKRMTGASVLAAQVFYHGTDGSLPDYQKPFLGGAATLRGHPAGEFIGDKLLIGSLEWRVPLTSKLAVYQGGFNLFFDTGTVYDHGQSINKARFHHGAGGGFFIFVLGLGLKIEVAHNLKDSARVHFSTGFRF